MNKNAIKYFQPVVKGLSGPGTLLTKHLKGEILSRISRKIFSYS